MNLLNFDIVKQRSILEKFGLLPILLRFFVKLNMFSYKILMNLLLNKFHANIEFKYSTLYRESRYSEVVKVPNLISNPGRSSFSFFLPKFVNIVIKNAFNHSMKDSKDSYQIIYYLTTIILL